MPPKHSLEQFIENARDAGVDVDSYDYSKAVYQGNSKHIIIICRRCGCEFTQRPDDHIKCGKTGGTPCPECRKKTPQELYEAVFRELHGDRYTYYWDEYAALTKLSTKTTRIRIFCNRCQRDIVKAAGPGVTIDNHRNRNHPIGCDCYAGNPYRP